ncbi:MAG: hypothetical protein WBV73_27815 [Phormidium sp.]
MNQLPTEQLLYLFYAFAYSDGDTVTMGDVKSHLPKELQKDADRVCDALCQIKLLDSPKTRRISVTEAGKKALIANLLNTDYQFDSQKGAKVVNALLSCLKLASSGAELSSVADEEMDFETFVEKFKDLYFEERRQQELRGVVAIRSQDICQKFINSNGISETKMKEYFEQLKVTGKLFAVIEKQDELIQWAE